MIAESTPSGSTTPSFKFIVTSTIVQHLVPTAQMNKPRGTGTSSDEPAATVKSEDVKPPLGLALATGTDGKPHVGRRGLNSGTGAYWNDKTDGMWTYKYEGGEGKGLDVIIHIIWIGL